MQRASFGLAVAAALITTSTWASPATAAPIPCRSEALAQLRGNVMETVRLRTFHIEAGSQADSYKIGTTAKVDVTVTRPAHQDPFDLGVEFEPPASAPAEDVLVGVGVYAGRVFVPGFSRTNADGKATIALKLPRYMTPDTASLTVYAWNIVHESPCLRVEEDGFASYPEAFEVTR